MTDETILTLDAVGTGVGVIAEIICISNSNIVLSQFFGLFTLYCAFDWGKHIGIFRADAYWKAHISELDIRTETHDPKEFVSTSKTPYGIVTSVFVLSDEHHSGQNKDEPIDSYVSRKISELLTANKDANLLQFQPMLGITIKHLDIPWRKAPASREERDQHVLSEFQKRIRGLFEQAANAHDARQTWDYECSKYPEWFQRDFDNKWIPIPGTEGVELQLLYTQLMKTFNLKGREPRAPRA